MCVAETDPVLSVCADAVTGKGIKRRSEESQGGGLWDGRPLSIHSRTNLGLDSSWNFFSLEPINILNVYFLSRLF